jgi:5'-phosphate synthase pdxT subunit
VSTVGVISIQGDFEKHLHSLAAIDVRAKEVRVPEDLAGIDRIIIPGGESTTVGKLMQRFGLADALKERADAGMPFWGTCMGMIMLAAKVEDREQFTLNLLNITVRRNAFGRQIHSFEDHVDFIGLQDGVTGVFIRAPIVTLVGEGVEVLSHYQGKIVAVRQGVRLGTSFHPELTDDYRLHRWFTNL